MTVELVVDGSVLAIRPPEAFVASIDGIFVRLAAGQDPNPSPPGTIRVAFPWLPVALGALLLAAVAALSVRRLRIGRPGAGASADVATVTDVDVDAEAPAAGDDITMKGSKIKEN